MKTTHKNRKNQVIWIIGASSGIGAALADYYGQQGAKLILSARRRDQLYMIKNRIKANPMHIHILPLDLERTSGLETHANEALRIFGRIDLLIHSAGVTQRAAAIDTLSQVEKKIMDINYWGPVILTKALLPSMIRQGGGQIAVMSSLMGKFATPMRSSYAASKHALHGYFEALGAETYDQHIRISLVCAGFVHTSLGQKALKADGSLYEKEDPGHAKAMSPEQFVQKLIPQLDKQKAEIFIGGSEMKALWASKYLPGFFRKKIRNAQVL